MTTALTSKPATQSLRQQLAGDYFKQQVALALPKHMTPDRFIRVGLTALMKTPKLLDCTSESVIQCMLNCSALGLEPDGRRAHLIPYGNVCTLIVDYKGIVELAKRSGDVSNVFVQVVCENDSFQWENGEVKHLIDFKRERGTMYAAYATITFKDGSKQTDVMTKHEVDAIRKRSKAGNSGPWVTDYNEMAKKTVFRRASKWITLSPEVSEALDKEDAPFSSATLVTDIANQPAPAARQVEAEETAPVEVDEVPMNTPTPMEAAEAAPVKPEAAPVDKAGEKTVQDQLAYVCETKGFTYSDFAKWAMESGNMPDADSFTCFEEVNSAIAKRLLRSTVGMLKGIGQVKGIAV
jgi:recombination protein RecT